MPPEVLIVGAGPTGLTLALELLRRGIAVRLIDRAATPHDQSRALQLGARTLRVLHQLGLAEAVLDAGHEIHGVNIYSEGERVAHVGFDDMDLPFPFNVVLPQSTTERLLTEALEKLGGRVERGVELTQAAADGEAMAVTVGGASARVPWLVGCDGADSTVRRLLPFEWEDVRPQAFIVADCVVDTKLPRDESHVFQTASGLVLLVPMLKAGHFRVVLDDPPRDAPDAPDRAYVADLVERRAGGVMIDGVTWAICLHRPHGLVVNRRLGRTFLAGDAAHCFAPLGDPGMNTGILDAQNLAWKLALVVQGAAPPALLDSYDLERRPPALTARHASDAVTRAVTLRHAVSRELRDRIAAFLLSLDAVRRKLALEVKYSRSPIVGEHRSPLRQAALVPDRTTEAPSVRDWLDFGAAPGPGEAIPDVPVEGKRLCDFLRDGQHTLLLFDGGAATAPGYQNLAAIAARARAAAGERIRTHIIVPSGTRPEAIPEAESVLLDDEHLLHRRFGAGAECLFLLRPDGYVGFRAQPATWDPLGEHLAKIFTAATP